MFPAAACCHIALQLLSAFTVVAYFTVETGHKESYVTTKVELCVNHALGNDSGHKGIHNIFYHPFGAIFFDEQVQEVAVDGEEYLDGTGVDVGSIHATV